MILFLNQMDVKTAYLNAPIDCEIYMDQAEGFEVLDSSQEKLVYKLNKSLYGLKQSGRNWNGVLHDFLLQNDFVQSQVDNCLYVRQNEAGMIIILVWVDDLIIAANDQQSMTDVKDKLKGRFRMKDLGKLSYFLGIDFSQCDRVVTMSQERYIRKLLERFEMSDCKPRSTPSEAKPESSNGSTCNEPIDESKYMEIVGSLIYAMTCTRPDLCWIVSYPNIWPTH